MTVRGLLALIFSTTTAADEGGTGSLTSVGGVGGIGSRDAGGDGGLEGAGIVGFGAELRWRRGARRREEEEGEVWEGWGKSS